MLLEYKNVRQRERQSFKKDAIIFRQGEIAKYWYEVVSGHARLCHYFGDGRRQVTHFPAAGDVFGFEHGLRQFSAEALTDLVLIRHEPLDGLDSTHSDEKQAQSQAVQRALESTERNLRLFSQPNACRRIGAFLLDFGNHSGAGDRIALPMSRQDLADHLGLTMHTVSRSISQLVKRGMLAAESPTHLIIADRPAFEEFVGVDWVEPDSHTRTSA